jgi:hypothetical protein
LGMVILQCTRDGWNINRAFKDHTKWPKK